MVKTFLDLNLGNMNHLIEREYLISCLLEGGITDLQLVNHSLFNTDFCSYRNSILLYLHTLAEYNKTGCKWIKSHLDTMTSELEDFFSTHREGFCIIPSHFYMDMNLIPFNFKIRTFNDGYTFKEFIKTYGMNIIPTELIYQAMGYDDDMYDDTEEDWYFPVEYTECTLSDSSLYDILFLSRYYYDFEEMIIYSKEIDAYLNKYYLNEEMTQKLLSKIESFIRLFLDNYLKFSKIRVLNKTFTDGDEKYSYSLCFSYVTLPETENRLLCYEDFNIFKNTMNNLRTLLEKNI